MKSLLLSLTRAVDDPQQSFQNLVYFVSELRAICHPCEGTKKRHSPSSRRPWTVSGCWILQRRWQPVWCGKHWEVSHKAPECQTHLRCTNTTGFKKSDTRPHSALHMDFIFYVFSPRTLDPWLGPSGSGQSGVLCSPRSVICRLPLNGSSTCPAIKRPP